MPKFLELSEVERINGLLDGLRAGDTIITARIEPYSLKSTVSEKKLFKELDTKYQQQSPPKGENNRVRKLSNLYQPPPLSDSDFWLESSESDDLEADHRLFSPSKKLKTQNSKGKNISHPLSTVDPAHVGEPLVEPLWMDENPFQGDLSQDSSLRKIFYSLIATLNAGFPDYDFRNVIPNEFHQTSLPQVSQELPSRFFVQEEWIQSLLEKDLWDAINQVFDGNVAECEVYCYVPNDDTEDPLREAGTIWSQILFFFHKRLKKIVLLKLKAENALTVSSTPEDVDAVSFVDSRPPTPEIVQRRGSHIVIALDT